MNSRQLKKIENIYLTKRDITANSKKLTKEQMRIEKEINGKRQAILVRDKFNYEPMFDEILDKFLHNNLDKLVIEDDYFNKLFISCVSKFSPTEFLNFDTKLSGITDVNEFYNTLFSETDFRLDFFKEFDIEKFNTVEIKAILNFENYLILEKEDKQQQLKDILGFELNWFKNPFFVLINYKLGSTRENIKNVVTYLNYYFDTPIEYEKDLKPFIWVSDISKVKGKRKKSKSNKKKIKKKVYTKNYEERIGKKNLFSSPNDSFYDFIFKNTTSIVLDEDNVRFLLDHEYLHELIICK